MLQQIVKIKNNFFFRTTSTLKSSLVSLKRKNYFKGRNNTTHLTDIGISNIPSKKENFNIQRE